MKGRSVLSWVSERNTVSQKVCIYALANHFSSALSDELEELRPNLSKHSRQLQYTAAIDYELRYSSTIPVCPHRVTKRFWWNDRNVGFECCLDSRVHRNGVCHTSLQPRAESSAEQLIRTLPVVETEIQEPSQALQRKRSVGIQSLRHRSIKTCQAHGRKHKLTAVSGMVRKS